MCFHLDGKRRRDSLNLRFLQSVFGPKVNGTLDPMVEEPSEETNQSQVDQRKQEVSRFFSKPSNMKIADKLKEWKVNEVEGEGDFPQPRQKGKHSLE